MAKLITTPISMQNTPEYRAVVRAVHMMPLFDRIGLSCILDIPFGSISRILTTFEGAGFVEKDSEHASYEDLHIKRNIELRQKRINYGGGKSGRRASVRMYKTKYWNDFMKIWNTFLLSHPKKIQKSSKFKKAA